MNELRRRLFELTSQATDGRLLTIKLL